MFLIDNLNKITIIEGDSGHFELKVNDYELREGDTVYFSVKGDDSEYLFQKRISEFEDGLCAIKIEPQDTKGKVGAYLYDVQITLASGYVDTVIPPTKFTVKAGITNE